ncbi:MAG: alpha/beta hydrolase [Marinobacter sp.]|uniref:alpha/beta fold hydrolase n=1 Tax=Marinobacter sp. TaxID=50741 RepID=UPI00299DDE09|nr:alpha/beta hydrolase [Marinobacter sp.]MDX1633348.1 alpha/beta hydrolase [Marinobacter sp.]
MMPPHPMLRILTLLALLVLAGCSRQTIYQTALDFERGRADLEVSSLQIGELTISYLSNPPIAGADTLVMLHGFGANKDNWLRMAGYLTKDYNVYAFDLPGHGDSSKPLDIGYSIADQVAYVNAMLDQLGLGRVHMMGNSMGGAITALYAATYPERVQSAVLFDPAGVFVYDSELVALVKQGENPLIVKQPGDFERLVDFALEQEPFVPWPIYSVMEERAIANREVNERIFAAIRDSGYQPGFRDALERITAPVLVVWGREDRITDYRNGIIFAERIPNARLEVLDGVGHAPMIEIPRRSATLVQEFIETAPDSGRVTQP